jgi:hypothetical protein
MAPPDSHSIAARVSLVSSADSDKLSADLTERNSEPKRSFLNEAANPLHEK